MKKLIQLLKAVSGAAPVENENMADTPQKPSSNHPPKLQHPSSLPKPSKAPTAKLGAQGFNELGLSAPICRAVLDEGYTTPTPIQSKAIPHVLAKRDLLGCAQTGTGKTAAFALPILHLLGTNKAPVRNIRTLVLTPTRELALQIQESFQTYGRHLPLRSTVVFGGVGMEPQRRACKQNPEILVATPGRLLDLMSQGCIDLGKLEIFVLDEADRMLDMGFIHDVKKVIKALPHKRQNLLFSATMPRDIVDLAMTVLKDPVKVEVTPVSSTSEQIAQTVYFVDRPNKRFLLLHVLDERQVTRALIFTRTKANANRVTEFLCKNGISSEAIHGNKSQSARQRALENFKRGSTKILVASDLAARGIDIEEISHVINYDIPNIPETYVHRIGRTGRAAATGEGISFCDAEEHGYLKDIERLIKKQVPVVSDHPFPAVEPTRAPAPQGGRRGGNRGGSRGGSQSGRGYGQTRLGRPPHSHGSQAPRSRNTSRGPRGGN